MRKGKGSAHTANGKGCCSDHTQRNGGGRFLYISYEVPVHDKFSGDTDVVKSTDKDQVQMTVDYLNTGYTILCRNCGKITFFDKEFMDGIKESNKNMPVRCRACKDKLVRNHE